MWPGAVVAGVILNIIPFPGLYPIIISNPLLGRVCDVVFPTNFKWTCFLSQTNCLAGYSGTIGQEPNRSFPVYPQDICEGNMGIAGEFLVGLSWLVLNHYNSIFQTFFVFPRCPSTKQKVHEPQRHMFYDCAFFLCVLIVYQKNLKNANKNQWQEFTLGFLFEVASR